jgi:eukaryotic-like serine/threonine-protein kinase
MLAVGTRLGPFAIRDLLGRGGMGEVYRAHDERLGRDVAIKVLPSVVALDPERRARFQREARVLATLNHPHIAAIYGAEEHEGCWALVLELVDGETLADVIRRGPVPATDVTNIALQLVDAIDAAHERGIVHRDLKPANVKISADGVVKVLDFGLAKAIVGSEEAPDPTNSPTVTSGGTRDGVIVGTAAYMSPEQTRGRLVDKRADIWAFGCLLFELLTAHPAFAGDTVSDVMIAVLQREPAWEALPSGTPPSLTSLIRRCLEKDPKARLRDIADARPSLRGADSEPSGAPAHVGRFPIVPLAASAVAGATLALAGAWLWERPSAAPSPTLDHLTRIVATSAHEYAPAISPDGKWIAYLSDARGPTDVWVQFVSSGEPANLTAKLDITVQAQDLIGGLQISPDGTTIAFAAGPPGTLPGRLSTWTIPAPLGGKPRRVLEPGSQALAWSPDMSRITFMRAGGAAGDSVWIADADGQHAREILKASGGLHTHWLRFSADGRWVLMNRGYQSFNAATTEIYRVSVDGGTPERVVASMRRAIYPSPDRDGRGLFYAANPDTTDLTLWWRDLRSGRDYRLINGVDEYSEPSVSADNKHLVATVTTTYQQLSRIELKNASPALQALSDPLSGDIDPAWSPDGARIAFSSTRGGFRNIWVAHADMSGLTPLTSDNAIDERPVFSPDGREVAFLSDRGGHRGVWLVNADGGALRSLVTAEVIGGVSWSPDGRQLVAAMPRSERAGLVLIAHDTGALTEINLPWAASAPDWSPRNVIAYLATLPGPATYVRIIDPTGKSAGDPFPDVSSQFSNAYIKWAPDGRRLAVTALPGAGPGSLWLLDPTGTVTQRKLVDLPLGTVLRGVAWSPDGSSQIVGVDKRSADIVLADIK